jgi:hypothetical protein
MLLLILGGSAHRCGKPRCFDERLCGFTEKIGFIRRYRFSDTASFRNQLPLLGAGRFSSELFAPQGHGFFPAMALSTFGW